MLAATVAYRTVQSPANQVGGRRRVSCGLPGGGKPLPYLEWIVGEPLAGILSGRPLRAPASPGVGLALRRYLATRADRTLLTGDMVGEDDLSVRKLLANPGLMGHQPESPAGPGLSSHPTTKNP